MNKEVNTLVMCKGRTSSQTYENYKIIYKYAKLNGFTDINVHFIEPETDKLRDRINKAIDYIEKYQYLIVDKDSREELLEILRGVDENN